MSDNPLSPELVAWGATFIPALVSPGELYWKLIQATGPVNIGGNHHLYVDTLDEAGNRVVNVRVAFYSQDEQWPVPSEAKPGEPWSANLPLFAGGHAYGVYVDEEDIGVDSDHLWGVGLGDHQPHHCFTAVFQRTRADTTAPTPTEPPPIDVEQRIKDELIQAQGHINYALGLLEGK